MSDAVQQALISAMVTIIMGLIVLVKQWLDKQAVIGVAVKVKEDLLVVTNKAAGDAKDAAIAASQASKKADVMASKQDEQHAAVNSRLTALLDATHEAGMKKGIEQEQARAAAALVLTRENEVNIEAAKLIDPTKRLEEVRGES